MSRRAQNRRAGTALKSPPPRSSRTSRPVAPRRRSEAGERLERAARAAAKAGALLLAQAVAALRRVPRVAWICAAIAFANAASWSLLTPPFQVTDEPPHFAYVQQLAENHKLPTSSEATFSPEENIVLRDLHQYEIRQSPETHTISTAAEQEQLSKDLAQHPPRQGEGGVAGAYNDPPLYYALETIPYGLADGGTLLDQLELMRLLSAVMAALTVLFIFLFLREAFPASRWSWTVGALCAALAPLLAFIGGAVTPDSMLAAVSAASFYALARGFRRGFTRPLAVAVGAIVAVGFLTKVNFIGLAPGIILGTVLLAIRAARDQGRAAYASLGMALAIATAPVWIYILFNIASGRPTLGVISTVLELHRAHGSIFTKLSYAWQLFLPRLPGMTDYFPGLLTTIDLWFNRGVGDYGWLDTGFPSWVNSVALIPAAIVLLLGLRGAFVEREQLRGRLSELLVYAAMCVGLLGLIGITSYIDRKEGLFAAPRYLLPLLPVLCAILALAARGAGRRLAPAVGAGLILLFLAHNVFSQLLVAGRFYG